MVSQQLQSVRQRLSQLDAASINNDGRQQQLLAALKAEAQRLLEEWTLYSNTTHRYRSEQVPKRACPRCADTTTSTNSCTSHARAMRHTCCASTTHHSLPSNRQPSATSTRHSHALALYRHPPALTHPQQYKAHRLAFPLLMPHHLKTSAFPLHNRASPHPHHPRPRL